MFVLRTMIEYISLDVGLGDIVEVCAIFVYLLNRIIFPTTLENI